MNFLALTLLLWSTCRGQNIEDLSRLDAIIQNKALYDRRIPPTNKENITEVQLALVILNMWDLSQLSMDCKIDFYLYQYWIDKRISFYPSSNYFQLTDSEINRFWIPKFYFPNAKKAEFHNVAVPNHFLYITPYGFIFYHFRVSLQFACSMHLHKFPFDDHRCFFQIASFSTNVKLSWINTDALPSVNVPNSIELPQFTLGNTSVSLCEGRFTGVNSSDCLQANFHFHRRIGFHLINTFIPSILIVIVSWGSFWMDADAVPGRISLGITTLLTISTKVSAVLSMTAEVSYVKAIDIWMMMCVALVFFSLCEFVVANYIMHYQLKIKRIKMSQMVDSDNDGGEFHTVIRCWTIDEVSRVLFPTIFLFFNVFYWSYYLN